MDWIEIPENKAQYQGTVLLLGASSWAAHNFLQRLSRPDQPIIWVDLSARDLTDPIAQGNRLAQAVERAFGSPLFGLGMPFSYGLSVLQKHQGLLGSFAIGVCGAEYALELVEALLAMPKLSQPLVLCFDDPPKLPGLKKAWQIDLRPAVRAAPVVVSEEEQALERQGIYNVLVAQRRWVEAFEWAALYLPTQAEQVLEKAANQMWAQGSCERLYRLLGQLPKTPQNSLMVLRWQFTALLELGREGEMLEDVRAVLVEQDAPELRAMYAIALLRVGDSESALRESQKALTSVKTPLTLYAFGLITPINDPKLSVDLLSDAISLAEAEDKLYVSAQAALSLTHTLYQLGRYKDMIEWSQWGMRLCDQRNLQNQQLRLALLNEWAFARILLGDTAGLESQVKDQIQYLSQLRPFTQMVFKTTVADLLTVEKRGLEALAIYKKLWKELEKRQHFNFFADGYVRVLLSQNELDEALAAAKTAIKLTEGLPFVFSRRSRLAYAIAESLHRPDEGIHLLKSAMAEFIQTDSEVVPLSTTVRLYLSRALLTVGANSEAEVHLSELAETFRSVGYEMLHFLAVPKDAFKEVFEYLEGVHYPLELNFLGRSQVRLNGAQVQLRRRFLEILAVLALNPEGLNTEELVLAVYGEKGTNETLRSDLSRLREIIPITPKPFKIQIPVKADFVDLQRLISRGKSREALKLYQGSLLSESTAEAIQEERLYLDNALRQLVLNSHDSEALMGLAEKLKGDLEVWEAAVESLSKNDPRRVLAQARVQNVSSQWN